MKRIAIVDDDEGILDALKAMLESAGYTVTISLTPDPILHLTRENSPDLILLDVLLSGQDGREICKMLKKTTAKKIPIVMMSAHPSAKESTRDIHADAFLEKPFGMDKLLKTVEECMLQ